MQELTQARLKEVLDYNPETGAFTWLIQLSPTGTAGSTAGTTGKEGYTSITINGKKYQSHRLAFLYMIGAMPPNDTDHINGIRDDNRWVNLRTVTRTENLRNAKRPNTNTSGVIGVFWRKDRSKWIASIGVNGKGKHTSYHDDWFEAVCARKSAEREYGFHENHGRAA